MLQLSVSPRDPSRHGSGPHALLCAHLQMGIFYFVSPRVTRSLVYGLAARNRLDLYRPPSQSKRPLEGYKVVIYITGEELGSRALSHGLTLPVLCMTSSS